jgi:class 3 adenylate cyclase
MTSPGKKGSGMPGKEHLKALLAERNQRPDAVTEIDRQIREAYERQAAILVLDLSGFTRRSVSHGIIHFLAIIQQMEVAATPAVVGNDGIVIKQEADNLFAVFKSAESALEGALDIFRAFEAVNSVVPEDRDLHCAVGIGYGKTLVIGRDDLFGEEMNLACKLGEDLAEPGEILLTEAAFENLGASKHRFDAVKFHIGGIDISAHRFLSPRSMA